MSRPPKYPAIDACGRRIRRADMVRVVGVPDLSDMSEAARSDSLPVFERLVGSYRRVSGFDQYGHVELAFAFRSGADAGHHVVWFEPYLVRVRQSRRGP